MKFTQLVEKIEPTFVSEGRNDPAIFKAVFILGGPGSGKTYLSLKIAAGAMGLRPVNSDNAFEYMMRKAGMGLTADQVYSDAGQNIRQKAQKTTERIERLYVDG